MCKKTMRVIFHENCLDGAAAAWIAQKLYQDVIYCPGNRFYPIKVDEESEEKLLFVDFVYKKEIMEGFRKSSLTVWDHHESSRFLEGEEFSESNVVLRFDKCAASIALEEAGDALREKLTEEEFDHLLEIIKFIEDRDLFLRKFSETDSIVSALYLLELNSPESFGKIFNYSIDLLKTIGSAVIKSNHKKIMQAVKNATDGFITIGGKKLKISVVTSHSAEISDLCYHLKKKKGCDIAAAAKFSIVRNTWQVSFRAYDDTDVNLLDLLEIAEDGGGHAKAASIICKNLDFFEVSNRKFSAKKK
jgi:nanoRNase/pAp phosphatase (c-di-AMP/oligoRNAs hydrolase)